MDDQFISFYRKNNNYSQTFDVLLDSSEGPHIQMELINTNEDKILRHSGFEFRKTRDHSQRIYVGNYIQMDIKNFIVRITSGKTHNVTEHKFVVMHDGSIIKL